MNGPAGIIICLLNEVAAELCFYGHGFFLLVNFATLLGFSGIALKVLDHLLIVLVDCDIENS